MTALGKRQLNSEMSVHDVAAVDHLNSLKVSRASKLPRKSPQNPVTSLPTSPSRDQRPNSDTLRQAMARHQVGGAVTPRRFSVNFVLCGRQASLSRPESPRSSCNDDIPGSSGGLKRINFPTNKSLYSPSTVGRKKERFEAEDLKKGFN